MRVVILCGISGSGKSTLASTKYAGARVCSADDYFMSGGEYNFDPRLLPRAHAACLRMFTENVRLGSKGPSLLVVDNTNTSVAELAPYAALATAFGWDLEIVIVKCEVGVACQRNTHGVPEAAIKGQAARLATLRESLPPWWAVTEIQAVIPAPTPIDDSCDDALGW